MTMPSVAYLHKDKRYYSGYQFLTVVFALPSNKKATHHNVRPAALPSESGLSRLRQQTPVILSTLHLGHSYAPTRGCIENFISTQPLYGVSGTPSLQATARSECHAQTETDVVPPVHSIYQHFAIVRRIKVIQRQMESETL